MEMVIEHQSTYPRYGCVLMPVVIVLAIIACAIYLTVVYKMSGQGLCTLNVPMDWLVFPQAQEISREREVIWPVLMRIERREYITTVNPDAVALWYDLFVADNYADREAKQMVVWELEPAVRGTLITVYAVCGVEIP
jgi:hypothetical protein